MTWAWTGPLMVAAVGAAGSAMLAHSLRREAERLRVARVEVRRLRSRLNRRPGAPGGPTAPAE